MSTNKYKIYDYNTKHIVECLLRRGFYLPYRYIKILLVIYNSTDKLRVEEVIEKCYHITNSQQSIRNYLSNLKRWKIITYYRGDCITLLF